MKAYAKVPLLIAILVLAVPALALATGGKEHAEGHGQGHGQEHSQGSGQPPGTGPEYTPSPPPQAKAYGKYCQGESKKHVAGEPGTPFSRCVTNMAHAAQHPGQTPREVCKGESKKHVKGEKGTAFSRCVKAAAKLRHDEHEAAE
jgi:hypothetical protein